MLFFPLGNCFDFWCCLTNSEFFSTQPLHGLPWGGSVVKNPPAMQKTQETYVRFLGQEDPQEEEMATHSSTLARKIPRTEEPGGLHSMGSQRVTRLSDSAWAQALPGGPKPGTSEVSQAGGALVLIALYCRVTVCLFFCYSASKESFFFFLTLFLLTQHLI